MTDLEEVPQGADGAISERLQYSERDMRALERSFERDAEAQAAVTSVTVIAFLLMGVMFGIGFTLALQAVIP